MPNEEESELVRLKSKVELLTERVKKLEALVEGLLDRERPRGELGSPEHPPKYG